MAASDVGHHNRLLDTRNLLQHPQHLNGSQMAMAHSPSLVSTSADVVAAELEWLTAQLRQQQQVQTLNRVPRPQHQHPMSRPVYHTCERPTTGKKTVTIVEDNNTESSV